MCKKIFKTLMLSITMMIICLAMSMTASALAETGQCGENVYWQYDSTTGKLVISGTGSIYDYDYNHGVSNAPWGSLFYEITEVVIGDQVTSIPDCAFFGHQSLKKVVISNSITEIGYGVFECCRNLKSITIPDSVKTIGEYAFYDCSGITELVIPDSVTTIGETAFCGCTGITELTIGNGVETIGRSAFSGCTGITELVIPDSVTSINTSAFSGCARLKKVTIGNGLTQISENMFANCAELNEIIIPDSVTSIVDYAFNGCDKLKSVFFTGTEAEWNSITMGTYNQNLTDLPIHFETTDHTWIVDEAVSATCTETGLTEGKHCSTCQLVGTAQDIIPALGHTVVVDEGIAPTCSGMGLTEGKHCSACQAVLTEQRILPATGMHTEESLPAVEATCTQTGLTEGSVCADCGKVIVKQNVIPATGHHSGEGLVLSEATCNSIGITMYKCVDCSVITDMVTVDALSHKMGEWTTVQAPTCTASGEEIRKCENCDHTETNILEKAEHTEEIVPSTSATCTSIGLTEGKICSDCGAVIVKQDVIPATGHRSDEGTVLSDLTCSHMGIKVFKCLDCGTVIEIETTEKLPHSEVILPAVAATCTYSGLTEGLACNACGETIIAQEETPVLEHSLGEWTVSVKPTCTDSGEIKRCCDDCDYTETGKVEATGHDPVTDKGVEATCNSTGLTEGSHCADCGTVFVSQDEIPMTDHEDNDGNGYCDYCDEDVDETDNCSCNCHKTGFIGFIWKIINFFNKLFKTNRVCECGA